uniref:Ig-like domain-containing protein n=2 Tax=Denticeps clupeoides TaxID=299321 RepID=A0AAY4A4H9_9TELE
MCLLPVWITFVVMLSGALGQYDWKLDYQISPRCALKTRSAVLTCSYRHPTDQQVVSVFWYNPTKKDKWFKKDEPEDLVLDSEYAGRVMYSTKEKQLILTITDLRERDSGKYHCMIMSDKRTYTDSNGDILHVSDVYMKSDPVTWNTEDQSATLTCNTICSTNKLFNWYKNGQYMKQSEDSVELSGKSDEASYFCSVASFDDIRSTAQCVLTERCWTTVYADMRVCALRGSSVDLSCTYTYPSNYIIQPGFWFIEWDNNNDFVSLLQNEQYKDRASYLGNKEKEAILRITNLIDSDSRQYRFRLLTETKNYNGKPGVQLNVTGLQVKVSPGSVREGQRVTLTCSTTCTLSNNPTYIWYKNRQPVSDKHTTRDNRLYLNSCSREDAGSYSCAVRGHEGRPSPEVPLRVECPPQNTLVLIISSPGTSSATLLCTSDASPPVHNYTWYKLHGAETSQIGSGQNYSITNISTEDNAQYFCEAKNDVGARNSTAVSLTGPGEHWKNIGLYVGLTVLVVVAASCALLWIMRKKKRNKDGDLLSPKNTNMDHCINTAIDMTPEPVQKNDTANEDIIQYSSIRVNALPEPHINSSTQVLYSTLKI